jgi:PleD family two-component response regulator
MANLKFRQQPVNTLEILKKGPPIQCIVANDNSFQLMAVSLNLQKFNINVIKAVNGFEAVLEV